MHFDSEEEKLNEEVSSNVEVDNNPIQFKRSLQWVFLPPIFAALIYSVTSLGFGFSYENAVGAAVVFMAALLMSTDKQDFDWYGFCFSTSAVGLFCIGTPFSHLFGGLSVFFAILTLSDANTGEGHKGKLALVSLYALNALLAFTVFALPAWSSIGLILLYALGILMVTLVPFSLAAKASLQEPLD